jgi:hypothetical protein
MDVVTRGRDSNKHTLQLDYETEMEKINDFREGLLNSQIKSVQQNARNFQQIFVYNQTFCSADLIDFLSRYSPLIYLQLFSWLQEQK